MADASIKKYGPLSLIAGGAFRFALVLATSVAVRFACLLSNAEKWDTPPLVPLIFLCELPLLFALAALIMGAAGERVARSAGIAFGAALTFLLTIPPLFFLTMMSIWEFPEVYHGLVKFEHFLPTCFIAAILLLFCAFQQRGNNKNAFLKSCLIGGAWVFVALALIAITRVPGSGEAKSKAAHHIVDLGTKSLGTETYARPAVFDLKKYSPVQHDRV